MKTLRAEYDIYVVAVGDRKHSPGASAEAPRELTTFDLRMTPYFR